MGQYSEGARSSQSNLEHVRKDFVMKYEPQSWQVATVSQ